MLRTGKQVWEATAKRTALDLRLQELEFHVQRFTTVTTQASLLAGFAFEGLVHMDVPEDADPNLEYAFWITGSLAMMFALYVLVVGSMVSILGHQLALLGASGDSLEDAVRILRNRRFSVFGSAGMALLMMVASAACMGLMKFGAAGEISSCRACSHTGSAPPGPTLHAALLYSLGGSGTGDLARSKSRTSRVAVPRAPAHQRLRCWIGLTSGFACAWLFGGFTLITMVSTCRIFCNLGNRELVTGATSIYTQGCAFCSHTSASPDDRPFDP